MYDRVHPTAKWIEVGQVSDLICLADLSSREDRSGQAQDLTYGIIMYAEIHGSAGAHGILSTPAANAQSAAAPRRNQ